MSLSTNYRSALLFPSSSNTSASSSSTLSTDLKQNLQISICIPSTNPSICTNIITQLSPISLDSSFLLLFKLNLQLFEIFLLQSTVASLLAFKSLIDPFVNQLHVVASLCEVVHDFSWDYLDFDELGSNKGRWEYVCNLRLHIFPFGWPMDVRIVP